MDADGKNITELTTEGNANGFVYPAWSPDGKKIVYAHPAASGLELFAVGVDGKNNKQLTKEGASNSYATWSKDGKRIAFGHFNGPMSAVKVMDADGSNVKTVVELVKTPPEGGRVAWKP
jgi:TolB protein